MSISHNRGVGGAGVLNSGEGVSALQVREGERREAIVDGDTDLDGYRPGSWCVSIFFSPGERSGDVV